MESWLSADIPNIDVALPNYLLFHHDRNHYDGGIVVYVKSHFSTSEVYISSKIEFLLYLLILIIAHFSIGTYCQPPSSSDYLDLLFVEVISLNPTILF